ASALSGALVAMLVPPTNSSAEAVRTAALAARDETHKQAVSAARQRADEFGVDAAKPGASPDDKNKAKAAADAFNEVVRLIPAAAALDLAARHATGSAQAAAAAATAIASDAMRRAAEESVAREHDPRQRAPAVGAGPEQPA